MITQDFTIRLNNGVAMPALGLGVFQSAAADTVGAVDSRTYDSARAKTFELIAAKGTAQDDFDPLFAALDADTAGSLDAVHDNTSMSLQNEPQRVRDDLDAFKAR